MRAMVLMAVSMLALARAAAAAPLPDLSWLSGD